MDQNNQQDSPQLFAVNPKTDCSHINLQLIENLYEVNREYGHNLFKAPCVSCQDASENWVCFECKAIKCSRYVNSHMADHNQETGHKIAVSLYDLSFWCYACDSYITNMSLQSLRLKLSDSKFTEVDNTQAEQQAKKDSDENEEILEKIRELKIQSQIQFKYQDLIEGIKSKQFKKICFLTGAGISVSSGIPDFRSPGTGLYSKLQQYNLPYAEAIFSIDYLKKQPEAFFQLAKEFLTIKAKPVVSHYFQAFIEERQQLLLTLTQNIDGLELDAGLPLDKLVQAHGHMRSTHCIGCKAEQKTDDFIKEISCEEIKIVRCQKCNDIVKPDIIFFGEQLPVEFFENFQKINQSDLVIVMGTSLKVTPFNQLVNLVKKETPLVLINRENPVIIIIIDNIQ